MKLEPSKELLRRLALAPGPPGFEDDVRRVVRNRLEGLGRLSHDRLGSLLCELPGPDGSPRVAVWSHMDEVGFLVRAVTDDGRLLLAPLGGWWGHVLLGQRVTVVAGSDRDARRTVPGVIGSKPPHFLTAEERNRVLALDAMYVDIGAGDADAVADLGVRVGDPVVPHAEFIDFAAEGVLSCKAFDNRVGVGVMCETLAAVAAAGDAVATVIGIATVQEEVGARGAGTASALARPDVAVVLEATPADDLPGVDVRQAVLGSGPQIRMFDPTAIANRRLVGLAASVAERNGISIQLAVRTTGGTDAKAIHVHGAGVPSVVIGVPARYIHSHVSLIQWGDYRAALALTVELVRALDAAAVLELTAFEV